MTAPSLPFTLYDRRPTDEAGIMQHSFEALVSLWCDALADHATDTAAAIVDGLRRFRRDMDRDALVSDMHRLCDLSAAVAELELRGEVWGGAYNVALTEYRDALADLATERVGA